MQDLKFWVKQKKGLERGAKFLPILPGQQSLQLNYKSPPSPYVTAYDRYHS